MYYTQINITLPSQMLKSTPKGLSSVKVFNKKNKPITSKTLIEYRIGDTISIEGFKPNQIEPEVIKLEPKKEKPTLAELGLDSDDDEPPKPAKSPPKPAKSPPKPRPPKTPPKPRPPKSPPKPRPKVFGLDDDDDDDDDSTRTYPEEPISKLSTLQTRSQDSVVQKREQEERELKLKKEIKVKRQDPEKLKSVKEIESMFREMRDMRDEDFRVGRREATEQELIADIDYERIFGTDSEEEEEPRKFSPEELFQMDEQNRLYREEYLPYEQRAEEEDRLKFQEEQRGLTEATFRKDYMSPYPNKAQLFSAKKKGIDNEIEDVIEIFYGLDPNTATKELIDFHSARFLFLNNPYKFMNSPTSVRNEKERIYQLIQEYQPRAKQLIDIINTQKVMGKWDYKSTINPELFKSAINIDRLQYPDDPNVMRQLQSRFSAPDTIINPPLSQPPQTQSQREIENIQKQMPRRTRVSPQETRRQIQSSVPLSSIQEEQRRIQRARPPPPRPKFDTTQEEDSTIRYSPYSLRLENRLVAPPTPRGINKEKVKEMVKARQTSQVARRQQQQAEELQATLQRETGRITPIPNFENYCDRCNRGIEDDYEDRFAYDYKGICHACSIRK